MYKRVQDIPREELLKYFRTARFCYKIGRSIVEDSFYDELVDVVAKEFPEAEELYQIYEMDKVYPEELKEMDVEEFDISIYQQRKKIDVKFEYEESVEYINDDNLSILPIKTQEELIQKYEELGSGTYYLSPKIDGIQNTIIYERIKEDLFGFKFAKTRGDLNNSINITVPLSEILPTVIRLNTKLNSVKFTSEAIMKTNKLVENGYKEERGGAQGVLCSTTNYKSDMYQDIRIFIHGHNLEAGYYNGMNDLKNIFKDVVTIYKIEADKIDIETLFNETEMIEAEINKWSSEESVPIDGIVTVQESSNNVTMKSSNKQYTSNVFANKINYWNREKFVSRVLEFKPEQQDVEISIPIIVEPVTTKSNKTYNKITELSLKKILEDDIKPGDLISFVYQNNTNMKYCGKVEENAIYRC